MEKAPQERYIFKPFYGSSHWWALNQIDKIPQSARVLDIGAGSGAIGKRLMEKGFQNLSAVEIDARARDYITPIYKAVHESLNPYKNEKFDLILLLDVLEHTATPEQFLNEILELLAPGGTILISVPNIAHWSIRFSLLFGIFNYTDRGLLDKTHLQFFTRKRLMNAAMNPNVDASEFSASTAPIEFLVPKTISGHPIFHYFSAARLFLAKMLPGLMAYQLLVSLKKR